MNSKCESLHRSSQEPQSDNSNSPMECDIEPCGRSRNTTSANNLLFWTQCQLLDSILPTATRLNLVGPLGAAVLQHQIALVAEEMVKKWMDRPVEEACQTAPLLDIVQGCHGYLFSKMFCS
ncbi:hypothetical protein MRB53_009559 [Persea americana]|uniref:Uncharacterized protein n=1 Tax=Persea americana TaxID=3435 RepID=A0ACC2LPC6_PERAE|nr:hypothetical protein MRB53_009559 [Persea americana]